MALTCVRGSSSRKKQNEVQRITAVPPCKMVTIIEMNVHVTEPFFEANTCNSYLGLVFNGISVSGYSFTGKIKEFERGSKLMKVLPL